METRVRRLDSLIKIQIEVNSGPDAIVIQKFLEFYMKVRMIKMKMCYINCYGVSDRYLLQIALIKSRKKYS